jgi:hypothetical protein
MSRIGALLALLFSSLALAGLATAATKPPHLLKGLPVIQLPGSQRSPVSCSAHARQARSKVARFARKLAPVACEQPPRSQVRDVGQLIIGP